MRSGFRGMEPRGRIGHDGSVRRALLALALAALGCGGFSEQPTKARFRTGSLDFWDLPFPSELRRSGGFELYRAPESAITETWLTTAEELVTKHGHGLTNGAFFAFDGPIDPAALPKSPAAATALDASVYIVDVDPSSPERGRRFPLDLSFRAAGDSARPENLLAMLPSRGFVRRPGTTYAAVVTNSLNDDAGVPVGSARAFYDALVDAEGADAEAAVSLAPLRAWLEEERIDPERIAGATVFRTLDPLARLRPLVDAVESWPAPDIVGWEAAEDYPDYRVVRATMDMPQVQDGVRPGEGRIVLEDGAPKKFGVQTIRLVFAIPKSPMPPDGFPLVIYNHGSGGEAYEGLDRGPEEPTGPPPLPDSPPGQGPAAFLARRGVAMLGFDFPLHGHRRDPPDTSGLDFYSLFGALRDKYNIRQTVDNMTVAAMEGTLISREALLVRIPESTATGLDAGNAPDHNIRFDPKKLSAMGHSMGTTLGVVIAGVDPRVNAWVFSGAGGGLIEVATETTYPAKLSGVIKTFLALPEGEEISRDHPLLHVFQNVWDLVDPVALARRVALEPDPARGPRPFLMYAGVTDGYFHPGAQTSLAVALGATIVGQSAEPLMPEVMALAGRSTAAAPLSRNLNGVTAGVVRYLVPYELGHWISFDREDARSQYVCFVLGVGTESGPRITEGGTDARPCGE
ncbi:MAG: hypothetical protein HYV07_08770 [Deltaproteobacteria bacterium]|nr:hypothetical protein [Deltaproteobacteria bacterium]